MHSKARYPSGSSAGQPMRSTAVSAVSNATSAIDGPRAFPILEAFERLSVGHVQGYALIRRGELTTYLIGRRRYCTAEEIRGFLERRIAASKKTDMRRAQKVAKATKASLISRGHSVRIGGEGGGQ